MNSLTIKKREKCHISAIWLLLRPQKHFIKKLYARRKKTMPSVFNTIDENTLYFII